MLMEMFESPLLQRVLLAALLASLACGVVGTFVVARRMATIAGGIAHAAFGGVGLGYWLGIDPMLGATGGMALGTIFIALAPGYAPDLTSYLFGSLLFVPWEYVRLIAVLDAFILVAVWVYSKELQAVCFDEEFSEVAGVAVGRIWLLLLALVALAVVALIRVVGIVLAIALLTMPAAVARQWSETLPRMMLIATVLCAFCTTSGVLVSWTLSSTAGVSLPAGGVVIIIAAILYAGSSAITALRRRPTR